jgi:hypothetical protein
MTIIPRKVKKEHGEYWELVDVKRVKGKVVQKYVGYLGKSPNSKKEIEPGEIMQYVERLLEKNISQDSINDILKKIGIEYDAWPITKIIIENDLRLKKVFLKLK